MPGALYVVNPTYSSDAANRIRDGNAREPGMGWNAAKGRGGRRAASRGLEEASETRGRWWRWRL
jgi:hypothetical protein